MQALVRRLVSVLTLGLFLAVSGRARACWDGYLATGDRVTVGVVGDSEWDPARIRRVATWVARLDALLPSGFELESYYGVASLRSGKQSLVDIEWTDYPELFDRVAETLGTSPRERARALRVRARPFTVQLLAARNEAAANDFADAIAYELAGEHGFIAMGGFPATNPYSHVIAERDQRGRTLHKVLVGAFMTHREAEEVRAAYERDLGLRGFVRRL